jgi:hypothetical protein
MCRYRTSYALRRAIPLPSSNRSAGNNNHNGLRTMLLAQAFPHLVIALI